MLPAMATFTALLLTTKTHRIKATYGGDATFKSSSGTVFRAVLHGRHRLDRRLILCNYHLDLN